MSQLHLKRRQKKTSKDDGFGPKKEAKKDKKDFKGCRNWT